MIIMEFIAFFHQITNINFCLGEDSGVNNYLSFICSFSYSQCGVHSEEVQKCFMPETETLGQKYDSLHSSKSMKCGYLK